VWGTAPEVDNMKREINLVCDKEDMDKRVQITDQSKTALPDYLDKLIITRKKGNDAIRVYGIRNFLRSKLNGISLIKLSKITKINYKNIQNWLCNSKRDVGIPLTELVAISNSLGIPREILFREIEYFGGTNTKRYKLPKQITSKPAYLLGYIMGDGHLANPSDIISNGSMYNAEIRITTNERHHLEYLQRIFIELFGYKPPLFKEKEFYRLVGRSKVIHRFLDKVCGIPTGNKKEKTHIPKILHGNKTLERYFLSGFFDADGTVSLVNNRIRWIRIKQYNKRILEQSADILHAADIKNVGIYNSNGLRNGRITRGYVLAIQNQRDIKQFTDIFFSLKLIDKGVIGNGGYKA
jgi:hypothetical protein